MSRRGIVLAFAVLALAGEAAAQRMPLPTDVQVPLLLKVLTFERRIAGARGNDLVIGVVYQSGYRQSAVVKDQVVEALSRARTGGPANRPLNTIAVDADREGDLEKVLGKAGVNVLYVSPLRAFDLRSLTGATRRNGILTVTGVPEYVEQGLSIGLDLRQERPRILVNLRAARAEGADLAAPLLGLVSVVDERP